MMLVRFSLRPLSPIAYSPAAHVLRPLKTRALKLRGLGLRTPKLGPAPVAPLVID
jgi:hypothetical protein